MRRAALSAALALAAPLALLAMTAMAAPSAAEESAPRALPAPALDPADTRQHATAIFAGGCFWGVEGVFSHVRGVTQVVAGYHGGTAATARYASVSRGDTGQAEAVRVTYDPRVVSYGTLLRVYFSVIVDPTQVDRQGPDSGRQYRSAIVPANDNQRRVAAAYIAQLTQARLWDRPIATRIEPPRTFYRAEAEHQDFMRLNPDNPYIQRWDAPKLVALRRLYPALYEVRSAR